MKRMSIFGTKEEILARLADFKRINELEERNPYYLPPDKAFSAISSLYNLMPPDAREYRADPRRDGARKMLAALAKLRG